MSPRVLEPNAVPRQARYWMATIPRGDWTPILPAGANWCIGQPERGSEGEGYLHWQVVIAFPKKVSRATLQKLLPKTGHYEPTRSAAAESYVIKENTRDGESFEFGSKLVNRNSEKDWDEIKKAAQEGRLEDVPSDIFLRYYSSLRRIAGKFI